MLSRITKLVNRYPFRIRAHYFLSTEIIFLSRINSFQIKTSYQKNFRLELSILISCQQNLFLSKQNYVFEDETVKKVNDIRNVCDLKSLSQKLTAKGSVLVGNLLIHADRILKTAMDKYWSSTETGRWHFVSKGSDNLKTTSKVVARLENKRSRLSFMEN